MENTKILTYILNEEEKKKLKDVMADDIRFEYQDVMEIPYEDRIKRNYVYRGVLGNSKVDVTIEEESYPDVPQARNTIYIVPENTSNRVFSQIHTWLKKAIK